MNQGPLTEGVKNSEPSDTPNKPHIKTGRRALKFLLILVFVTIILLLVISHKIEPTLIAVLIAFLLGFIAGKSK